MSNNEDDLQKRNDSGGSGKPSVGGGTVSMLAGSITNTKSGSISASDDFRRYVGRVQTKTVINGRPDVNQKSILYEIGKREVAPIDRLKDESIKIPMAVKVNEIYDVELTGLHKKFSNFDGKYSRMDLSGILFILGKAMAQFNESGKLTTSDLSLSEPLNVVSLKSSAEPVTSSRSGVMITRLASSFFSPATFCALVHATNGSGSVVYTDLVEVDGNNAVMIESYSDALLFNGVVQAVKIIFRMYDKFSEGSCAAIALLRGLHSVSTVVGHTDEGGYFRDVLRAGKHVPSYGAIYVSENEKSELVCFPTPSGANRTSVCAVVDEILLISAAGVALCDPGVKIGERVYPTVLTNSGKPVMSKKKTEVGKEIVPELSYSAGHLSKISNCGQTFFRKYAEFAAKMFGLTDTTFRASDFLAMSHSLLKSSRHLEFETVGPFFWIEPTTLFRDELGNFNRTPSMGPVAYTDIDVEMDFFPKIVQYQQVSNHGLYATKMKNFRESGLFLHLQGHKEDGLANITPWNYVDEMWALLGGNVPAGNAHGRFSVDKYMWGRGQSSIFAPSEGVYLGDHILYRMIFSHVTPDYEVELTHLPSSEELLGGKVTVSAVRPFRIENAKMSTFTKSMSRSRSEAIKALDRASQITSAFGQTGGVLVAPGNREVLMPDIADDTGVGLNPLFIGSDELKMSKTLKRGAPKKITYEDSFVKPKSQVQKGSQGGFSSPSGKGLEDKGKGSILELKEEEGVRKGGEMEEKIGKNDDNEKNIESLEADVGGTSVPLPPVN